MPRVKIGPFVADNVVNFRAVLDDGAEQVIPKSAATVDPDDSTKIIYRHDITEVPVGTHTLLLGVFNGWEVTWATNPLSFTRPEPITQFTMTLEYD